MASAPTRGRVLVLGDSGVGKTSLVHRLCRHELLDAPQWTVGCNVEVRLMRKSQLLNGSTLTTFGNQVMGGNAGMNSDYTSMGLSSSIGGASVVAGNGGSADDLFFVEFLDVGCHKNHEASRSIYYEHVDGIMLVYDMSNYKSFENLRKWVAEVKQQVKHSNSNTPAPSRTQASTVPGIYQRSHSSGFNLGGLLGSMSGYNSSATSPATPVEKRINDLPVIVVGNKLDIVRGWRTNRIPDVYKLLGFETVNVSALQGGGDIDDKIDHFLRQVVESRGASEHFPGELFQMNAGSIV